jgi:hypothetical protein
MLLTANIKAVLNNILCKKKKGNSSDEFFKFKNFKYGQSLIRREIIT